VIGVYGGRGEEGGETVEREKRGGRKERGGRVYGGRKEGEGVIWNERGRREEGEIWRGYGGKGEGKGGSGDVEGESEGKDRIGSGSGNNAEIQCPMPMPNCHLSSKSVLKKMYSKSIIPSHFKPRSFQNTKIWPFV
jgi:hypothetical protein